MPRSNTNTPSSARAAKRHRRATISAKRAASRAGPRPLTVRDSPKDTIQKPASGSGIVHGVKKGVPRTAKAARKKERNQVYATQRAVEAAAEELLQKKGEVEMVDMATVPLSKRQQKLAERRRAAEEHNKGKGVAVSTDAPSKKTVEDIDVMVDDDDDWEAMEEADDTMEVE